MAREGEGQHDAKERWRSFGVTRGQLCKQEVARGRPSTAGGAALCSAAVSKQAGRKGKGKKGQFAISNNSRDQNVKPTITFNIGLK